MDRKNKNMTSKTVLTKQAPEPPNNATKTAKVKKPKAYNQKASASESVSKLEGSTTASKTNKTIHHETPNNEGLHIDKTDNHQDFNTSDFEYGLDMSTTLERVGIILGTWILENLNGNNIRELLAQTPGAENNEGLRTGLQNLYEVIQQLNLELLNIFDNYLCFDGAEDQAQWKRLSEMACTRAQDALAAKNSTHVIFINQLFNQVSKKLCSNYAYENRKISNQESSIVHKAATDICNEYESQMQKYIEMGAPNIDEYHDKIAQYSLGALDRVLDFSAKMSYIHTTTSTSLDNELNETFIRLKQTCGKKPVTEAKLPSKTHSKEVINSDSLIRGKTMPVEVEVAKYREIINAGWSSQKDCKALEMLHEEALKTIGTNLSPEDRFTMSLETDRYFAQICNHFEFQNGNREESGKCVTIYFTDTKVYLGVITRFGQGWNSRVNLNDCIFSKFLGPKIPIPKLIQMLTSQNPKELVKSRKHISKLLKRVKTKAETKAVRVEQICIIIPTWFQLGEISELRSMAFRAGFPRIYCMRESCAMIYAIVRDSRITYETYVVITAHHFNINVDIFKVQNQKNIQLISLAACSDDEPCKDEETNWSPVYSPIVGQSDIQSEGRGFCNKFFQKLNEVFNVALSHLSEHDKNAKKACFFVCNHSSMEQVFDLFLEAKARLLHKLPIHSQLAWSQTLTSLAENWRLLDSEIIDHIVPTTEHEKHFVHSSSNFGIDFNGLMSRKDELLAKCRLIREHLDKEKVTLGVLMKKLVLQSLEQAESVAEEASEEDISEQCAKVDTIISQHKFDISL